MKTEEMNIYEKIQWVKEQLLEANLKKSGYNKFADFKYYELADFLPTIIKLCKEVRLFTAPTFTKDEAILTIVNIDNPGQTWLYQSPMAELELKGCNKVQALGGTETYERRYLYMSAFDITENDMFDTVSGKEQGEEKQEKTATPKQIEMLEAKLTDEEKQKTLEYYKIKDYSELTIRQASALISKKMGE